MFDAFYHIWTGGTFGVTVCDAMVYVVGEHQFPTSGITFFPNVAFAIYDFWGYVREVLKRRGV